MTHLVLLMAPPGAELRGLDQALTDVGFRVHRPSPNPAEDGPSLGISGDACPSAVLVWLCRGEEALESLKPFLAESPVRGLPRIGVVEDPSAHQSDGWNCQDYVEATEEAVIRAVRNLSGARQEISPPPSIESLSDVGSTLSDSLAGPLSLASAIGYVASKLGPEMSKSELVKLIQDAELEGERMASILQDVDAIDSFHDGRMQSLSDQESESLDLSQLVRNFAKDPARTHKVGGPQVVVVAPQDPFVIEASSLSLEALLEKWWRVANEDAPQGSQMIEFTKNGHQDRVSLALIPPPLPSAQDRPATRKTSVITAPPGRDLALGLLRALAELHGGALSISFQPGGVTTYAIRFPE